MNRALFITLLVCILFTACAGESTPAPIAIPVLSEPEVEIIFNPTLTPSPVVTPSPIPATPHSTTTALTPQQTLDPNDWKNWSVIPSFIDPSLQKVYEHGLSLGNDPHAFSIF